MHKKPNIVVYELIDNIIEHMNNLSKKITKLSTEMRRNTSSVGMDSMIIKNTIEIYKKEIETLSKILRNTIEQIVEITAHRKTDNAQNLDIENNASWNAMIKLIKKDKK